MTMSLPVASKRFEEALATALAATGVPLTMRHIDGMLLIAAGSESFWWEAGTPGGESFRMPIERRHLVRDPVRLAAFSAAHAALMWQLEKGEGSPRGPAPWADGRHMASQLADTCGVLRSRLAEADRQIGALTREIERLKGARR